MQVASYMKFKKVIQFEFFMYINLHVKNSLHIYPALGSQSPIS